MNQYLIIFVLVISFPKFYDAENISNTATDSNSTTVITTTLSPEGTNVSSTTSAPSSPTPENITSNATTLPSTPSTPAATVKPATESSTASGSTVTPAISEETTPSSQKSASRQFHAPSFIGGIVLSVGLMAISFVGFKFYRSRTERNYHTLRESLHM